MLPVYVKTYITRLDAQTFTELMRSLLQAEAAKHGLPPDAVTASDAVNEGDGGLDATFDGVPTGESVVPPGRSGFQFKAYKSKTIGPKEYETELSKPGPTALLKAGGTYVLAWTADLNPQQRASELTKLEAAAAEISTVGTCLIWDASAVLALAENFPAVVDEFNFTDFHAVRALNELDDSLRVRERPFQSDESRANAIAQIRARADRDEDDAIVVTVNGLPGTGKTRTVLEALGEPPYRDRTMYCDSSDGVQRFINRVVNDDRTRGILVVDELDTATRDQITSRIGATRGRWRLLAVVPQMNRRFRPAGERDVHLLPLDGEATRQLVEAASGLTSTTAARVAEVTRGFPALAFRLAEELRADPDLNLAQLAQLDQPRALLDRILPNSELREALKPLALFSGLGFEDELAYEFDAVAVAFGRDVTQLRHHVTKELERARFVSSAGRFRSVSPTLVAVWLAAELIDDTPSFDAVIESLPQQVQEAFFKQLEFFGPESQQITGPLKRLVGQEKFTDPESFSAAAGRILRASAAVIPADVARIIRQLVTSATIERRRTMPRRDLVWALQIALWWSESWGDAIEALYVLASTETETWSNNATGTFRDAFSVYLSGSTVPFDVRGAWLSDRLTTSTAAERPLIVAGAASGLSRSRTRTVVGFRGGGEPQDWQPESVEELQRAHRCSWDILMQTIRIAHPGARHDSVSALADGLWPMLSVGLEETVETSLASVTWTASERAELLQHLRRIKRGPTEWPEFVRSSMERIEIQLAGEASATRIETVLATPIWHLFDEAPTSTNPAILEEIASEIAAAPDVVAALGLGRDRANDATRYRVLFLVATTIGHERMADYALQAEPFDVRAMAAAIGRAQADGHADWIDKTLDSLAESPDTAQFVPELTASAPITATRLQRVLKVADAAPELLRPLGHLRVDSAVASLGHDLISQLVRALTGAGFLEGALSLLAQFGENEESPPLPNGLLPLAAELCVAAIESPEPNTMRDFYVQLLVKGQDFPPDTLLDLWDRRIRITNGLDDELDGLLTARAIKVAPHEFLDRIVRLIKDEADGRATFGFLSAQQAAVLSRIASEIGVGETWNELLAMNEQELRHGIHHMDWSGQKPDALVATLLESPQLAGFETEAWVAFRNTLGVVMGDYWRGLEQELLRIRSWRSHLHSQQALLWVDNAIAQYVHEIEREKRRGEEQDFLLG